MNKRFRRIAVLMGGPSSERDISLASGRAVASALTGLGYVVTPVILADDRVDLPGETEAVFIALHGAFGEDGQLQSILEARGIPFTGSGSAASRLAFDKLETKKVLEQCGIPTPPYEMLGAGQPPTLSLPLVIKPPRQGSSIGIHIVKDPTAWTAACEHALSFGPDVMVEAFIPGRELTVGVIDRQVLPIVEIRAPEGNYDFQAKYTKGMTEYLCPAPLPDAVTRTLQQIALDTFDALGCRGLGRVDFRLTEANEPFVLELNSIPGFTETSLLPKAAKAAGIEFPDLCERVLNQARC